MTHFARTVCSPTRKLVTRFPASSDDHIGIALEQHFLVDRGMSAGQIGCAIHGAIFGHLDAISELAA